MRSIWRRARPTGGRSDATSSRLGLGACAPDAMKAARPPGLSTDGVEDGVAILRHLSEILRVVVDDFVGSEATHIVAVRRARGGDHMGADMLGELNGKAGDATRPALDEDRLPALELQRILDRAQGREPGER